MPIRTPRLLMTALRLTSDSAETTRDIAARLGACLRAGDVVALFGDLGAGKTCFVQGLARGLGIAANIASPTFILMRHHPGDPPLCHADAYRLSSPQELEDLGLEDILVTSVLAIEWADRVLDALPEHRIEVVLTDIGDDRRALRLEARGERPCTVLKEAFG